MSLKDDLKLNTPRRTPNHATKSHVVKTNVDGKPKMIRFGEQGASTAGKPSPNDSAATKAKRKSFKARHASNIAKGPASAAYWSNRVKWAKGGPVKLLNSPLDSPIGVAKDITNDLLSGIASPIISSSGWLMDKYFTDYTEDEREARYQSLSDATNYTPRTAGGQFVNETSMQALEDMMGKAATFYGGRTDMLDPEVIQTAQALEEAYGSLEPGTRDTIGHALVAGEAFVPFLGKAVGAAKGAVRNAGDRRMISDAASDVPDESSYLPLQDRLEEMGARQLMEDSVDPVQQRPETTTLDSSKLTKAQTVSALTDQFKESHPPIGSIDSATGKPVDQRLINKRANAYAKQLKVPAVLRREAYTLDKKIQKVKSQDRRIIHPEELIGKTGVPVVGDRSSRIVGENKAERAIVDIRGVPLSSGHIPQGGFEYSRDHGGWASMSDAAKKKQANFVTAQIASGGGDILGIYSAMGREAINFSVDALIPMIKQLPAIKIPKKDIKAFDEAIRKGVIKIKVDKKTGEMKKINTAMPDWLGLEHPEVMDQLIGQGDFPREGAGAKRKVVLNQMVLKKWEKLGFPVYDDVVETMTAPELSQYKTAETGLTMFKADPFADTYPSSDHLSYDTDIPGEYFGGLFASVPPEIMYPDMFKMLSQKMTDPKSGAKPRPLSYSDQTGSLMIDPKLYEVYTPEKIENIIKYLNATEGTNYAEGGEVEVAEEVSVEYNADKISAMADALMNGDSYAKGGEVKSDGSGKSRGTLSPQFKDPNAIAITGDGTVVYKKGTGPKVNKDNYPRTNTIPNVVGEVATDFVSGMAAPFGAAFLAEGEKLIDGLPFVEPSSMEERIANRQMYEDFLNFEPRTTGAQYVNKKFGEGVEYVGKQASEYYDRNKKYLSPEVQQSIAGVGNWWENLDPEIKFSAENMFTMAEPFIGGKAVSLVGDAIEGASNASKIQKLAGNYEQSRPSPAQMQASTDALQQRLIDAGMPAPMMQVRSKGSNNFLKEFDYGPYSGADKVADTLKFNVDMVGWSDMDDGFRRLIREGNADLPASVSALPLDEQVDYLKSQAQEEAYNNEDMNATDGPATTYFKNNFPEEFVAKIERDFPGSKDTNKWVNTKLKRYLRTEIGTGQNDSVVKIAGENQSRRMGGENNPMHFKSLTSEDIKNTRDDYGNSPDDIYKLDFELEDYGNDFGDPIANESLTDLARIYEGASDQSLYQQPAGSFSDFGLFSDDGNSRYKKQENLQEMLDRNMFIPSLDPETSVFSLDPEIVDNLQLRTLVEGAREMIDPTNAAGLPENLRRTGAQLQSMSVGEVSNRVGINRNWQVDKEFQVEKKKLAENLDKGTVYFVDPDFDLKGKKLASEDKNLTWIKYGDTQIESNKKNCNDVSTFAGWCTQSTSYAKAYGSGDNRTIVAVDGNGRPHLQATFIRRDDSDLSESERQLQRNGAPMKIDLRAIKPVENDLTNPMALSFIRRDPDYVEKIADGTANFLNEISNDPQYTLIGFADDGKPDLEDLGVFQDRNGWASDQKVDEAIGEIFGYQRGYSYGGATPEGRRLYEYAVRDAQEKGIKPPRFMTVSILDKFIRDNLRTDIEHINEMYQNQLQFGIDQKNQSVESRQAELTGEIRNILDEAEDNLEAGLGPPVRADERNADFMDDVDAMEAEADGFGRGLNDLEIQAAGQATLRLAPEMEFEDAFEMVNFTDARQAHPADRLTAMYNLIRYSRDADTEYSNPFMLDGVWPDDYESIRADAEDMQARFQNGTETMQSSINKLFLSQTESFDRMFLVNNHSIIKNMIIHNEVPNSRGEVTAFEDMEVAQTREQMEQRQAVSRQALEEAQREIGYESYSADEMDNMLPFELDAARRNVIYAMQELRGENDFAKGGAVIAKYDADKINKLAQGIMPENFAEGGPVIYNASRINEIANQLLQEA